MPKQHAIVVITWRDKNSSNYLRLFNLTTQEAIDQAIYFGWQPPKWWQIWKRSTPALYIID